MNNNIDMTNQTNVETCQDLDESKVKLRLSIIKEEIEVLKSRVKPHDTGHIRTAISVMSRRAQEIEKRLHGDPDWYNEYL